MCVSPDDCPADTIVKAWLICSITHTSRFTPRPVLITEASRSTTNSSHQSLSNMTGSMTCFTLFGLVFSFFDFLIKMDKIGTVIEMSTKHVICEVINQGQNYSEIVF